MLTRKEEALMDTPAKSRWAHALRIDWLGQMVASLLWTASVFVYGITEAGDVVQLSAALAWAVANVAALLRASEA